MASDFFKFDFGLWGDDEAPSPFMNDVLRDNLEREREERAQAEKAKRAKHPWINAALDLPFREYDKSPGNAPAPDWYGDVRNAVIGQVEEVQGFTDPLMEAMSLPKQGIDLLAREGLAATGFKSLAPKEGNESGQLIWNTLPHNIAKKVIPEPEAVKQYKAETPWMNEFEEFGNTLGEGASGMLADPTTYALSKIPGAIFAPGMFDQVTQGLEQGGGAGYANAMLGAAGLGMIGAPHISRAREAIHPAEIGTRVPSKAERVGEAVDFEGDREHFTQMSRDWLDQSFPGTKEGSSGFDFDIDPETSSFAMYKDGAKQFGAKVIPGNKKLGTVITPEGIDKGAKGSPERIPTVGYNKIGELASEGRIDLTNPVLSKGSKSVRSEFMPEDSTVINANRAAKANVQELADLSEFQPGTSRAGKSLTPEEAQRGVQFLNEDKGKEFFPEAQAVKRSIEWLENNDPRYFTESFGEQPAARGESLEGYRLTDEGLVAQPRGFFDDLFGERSPEQGMSPEAGSADFFSPREVLRGFKPTEQGAVGPFGKSPKKPPQEGQGYKSNADEVIADLGEDFDPLVASEYKRNPRTRQEKLSSPEELDPFRNIPDPPAAPPRMPLSAKDKRGLQQGQDRPVKVDELFDPETGEVLEGAQEAPRQAKPRGPTKPPEIPAEGDMTFEPPEEAPVNFRVKLDNGEIYKTKGTDHQQVLEEVNARLAERGYSAKAVEAEAVKDPLARAAEGEPGFEESARRIKRDTEKVEAQVARDQSREEARGLKEQVQLSDKLEREQGREAAGREQFVNRIKNMSEREQAAAIRSEAKRQGIDEKRRASFVAGLEKAVAREKASALKKEMNTSHTVKLSNGKTMTVKAASPDDAIKVADARLSKYGSPLKAQSAKLSEQARVDRLGSDTEIPTTESKKTWIDVVTDIPKELKSSLDVSFAGRQGLFFLNRAGGRKGVKEGLHSLVSKNKHENVKKYLGEQWANRDLAKQAELNQVEYDPTSPENKSEEFGYQSLGKIPGIKQTERSFIDSGNLVRANMFDEFVGKHGKGKTFEKNPEFFKGVADYVNTLTGRRPLPEKIRHVSNIANKFLWSPQFVNSRIALMNPRFYYKLPKEMRMEALRDVGGTLGAMATLTGAIAATAKGAGEDVDVGTNPLASNFGWLKVGKTSYNLFAGTSQLVKLYSRLATGRIEEKDDTKKLRGFSPGSALGLNEDLDEASFEGSTGKEVGRFVRSKEGPTLGSAHNLLTGEDYIGQKFDASDLPEALFAPMSIEEFISAYKHHGLAEAIKTLPSFFGLQTQTEKPRKDEEEDSKSPRRKRQKRKRQVSDNSRSPAFSGLYGNPFVEGNL